MARSCLPGITRCAPQENSVLFLIINPVSIKLVRSRWLDISLCLILGCLLTATSSRSIKGELKAKNRYFFIYGLDHIQYCFQLFSGIFLVFRPKKNYLIRILGHRHCGSERMSQRSFLQVMTYDMGKICQNASYRSSVLTDARLMLDLNIESVKKVKKHFRYMR